MLLWGLLVSAAKFAGLLSWSLNRRQEGVYFEKQSTKLGASEVSNRVLRFLIGAPTSEGDADEASSLFIFLTESTRNL